jgi:hypothetical protein
MGSLAVISLVVSALVAPLCATKRVMIDNTHVVVQRSLGDYYLPA